MTQEKGKKRFSFDPIFDRRLYGLPFIFWGFGYILLGFILNYLLVYRYRPFQTFLYSIGYFGFLLLSGFLTKNVGGRQFHLMSWNYSILFFLVSMLSKGFMILNKYGTFFPVLFEITLIAIITETAYLISLISIGVRSQRLSIRNSIGISNTFFKEKKEIWKECLKNFPNHENIINEINQGSIITNIFDWGFFNLTILWSCNTMEQIIVAVKDGLITIDPNKRYLFENKNGKRIRFSKILNNLSFSYNDESGFTERKLWHDLRNDIAHRNKIPSFNEIESTLKLLISFFSEMPHLLNKIHDEIILAHKPINHL